MVAVADWDNLGRTKLRSAIDVHMVNNTFPFWVNDKLWPHGTRQCLVKGTADLCSFDPYNILVVRVSEVCPLAISKIHVTHLYRIHILVCQYQPSGPESLPACLPVTQVTSSLSFLPWVLCITRWRWSRPRLPSKQRWTVWLGRLCLSECGLCWCWYKIWHRVWASNLCVCARCRAWVFCILVWLDHYERNHLSLV